MKPQEDDELLPHEKVSWWRRMTYKYRLVIIDEQNWDEKRAIYVSKLGIVLTTLFIVVVLFFLFIAISYWTPFRYFTTDYTSAKDLNQTLILQLERIDSLNSVVDVQTQYMQTLRRIVSGDIKRDSITSLDSMQLINQVQLRESRAEVTDEFMSQYEESTHEDILLFEMPATSVVHTLYRPMAGSVVRHFSRPDKQYSTLIQASKRTSVFSVLKGLVVNVTYDLTGLYTITILHEKYLSIYRNLSSVIKKSGDRVDLGEVIGFMNSGSTLDFSLWQETRPCDPEELIVF